MMSEFHFIRPLWLLLLVPFVFFAGYMLRQKAGATAWSKVCDQHLLPYLLKTRNVNRPTFAITLLLLSAILLTISLAGPTWSRLPVPTYQRIHPRVVLLDMSDGMLMNDLSPDRLSRAKFKLHDLFQHQNAGQFGLIAYTSEPFVVSPLTDDGETIDALLSSLTPDVMPVEGQNLASALEEAKSLIAQAGFSRGQILVLTGMAPSPESISMAKKLASLGITISMIPMLGRDSSLDYSYEAFARAGRGELIPLSDLSTDIERWLADKPGKRLYKANANNDMPVWRDQGRWFIVPALFLLLPAFRRGWLP